jgi:tRNA dimethylallyltransferase
MLRKVDPELSMTTSPENVKRVIRALEVFEMTGVPLSEWNKKSMEKANKKNALVIGITFEDRQDLYDRIEKRIDLMLEQGILDETKHLLDLGIKHSKTASQAIGYKEFYPYFDGTKTLCECVETLKINTRHYAKRQLTWFRRNPDIKWIIRQKNDNENAVFKKAGDLVNEFLTEV